MDRHPTPPTGPDFDALIADAQVNRRPVSLDQARKDLGDLFDEADLAQETLVIRGGTEMSLTPTAWIRVVRKAQATQAEQRD